VQQEIDQLPPRHAPFDQHLRKFGQQGRQSLLVGLGPAERDRREMAVLNASSAKPLVAAGQQPDGKDDLTLRLLKLSTHSREVMAKMIARWLPMKLCPQRSKLRTMSFVTLWCCMLWRQCHKQCTDTAVHHARMIALWLDPPVI
jgi:hypothetical protein